MTYGVYVDSLALTAARTFAHTPSLTKLAVVAPLFAKFFPTDPFARVVRNPSPQPLPTAVVESPAKKKAGDLAALSTFELAMGVACATAKSAAENIEERRMFVFVKSKVKKMMVSELNWIVMKV